MKRRMAFVIAATLLLLTAAGAAIAGGYCPYCGAQVNPGWSFCPECGNGLPGTSGGSSWDSGYNWDSGYDRDDGNTVNNENQGGSQQHQAVPYVWLFAGAEKGTGRVYTRIRWNGVPGAEKYIINWSSRGKESGYLKHGEGHGSGQLATVYAYDKQEFYTSSGERYEYYYQQFPVDYEVEYTYSIIAVFPDGQTTVSPSNTVKALKHK